MAYSFDEYLRDSFSYTPIPEINPDNLPALAADWLTDLASLCGFSNTAPLTKHTKSTYYLKEEVISVLKILYHRLKGNLNPQLGPITASEKEGILCKIREDISQCAPGFHNRINSIYQSFKQPKTLEQLLFKVRMSLVQKVATQLTREVHANNTCFVVANADGLGVEPLLKKDPYRGTLDNTTIRTALEKTFKLEYRAFNLAFLLCDQLRGTLGFSGYEGRIKSEDGYTPNTAEKITECIRTILDQPDLTWRSLFIVTGEEENTYEEGTPEEKSIDDETLSEDEKAEKGNGPFIKDLNWEKLQTLFFVALEKKHIIKENSEPSTLLECLYFSKIFRNLIRKKRRHTRKNKKLFQIKKANSIHYLTYR